MRPSLLAATAAVLLAGCSPAGGADGDTDAPLVATTVSPLTSIVAQIGGADVRVVGIVPEDTNSHTFEPAPAVAGLLSVADLIIANGMQLEEPTLELAEANKKPATQIVTLGDRVLSPADHAYDFSFPEAQGKPNPHVWTDPQLAQRYAAVVADELTELDPENAAGYQRRLEQFRSTAIHLDEALQTDQASVPNGIRLVTYHDSFAYIARRLDWRVVGAVQPADFSEPSAAEVAAIIDQVRAEKVPAIFGSEVFPSPVLAQIAAETDAAYIEDLRDDDLPGEPGDALHHWAGMMRFDFITIIEGLGGRADALRALSLDAPADSGEYPL